MKTGKILSLGCHNLTRSGLSYEACPKTGFVFARKFHVTCGVDCRNQRSRALPLRTLPPAQWAGRQWRMSKAFRLKGHCNRLLAICELPAHQAKTWWCFSWHVGKGASRLYALFLSSSISCVYRHSVRRQCGTRSIRHCRFPTKAELRRDRQRRAEAGTAFFGDQKPGIGTCGARMSD